MSYGSKDWQQQQATKAINPIEPHFAGFVVQLAFDLSKICD
jgi:hypothetical protein